MELLKKLCSIHAPSGEEYNLKEFIISYIKENKNNWNVQPTIFTGDNFQDCIVLIFGTPKTAAYAHMDSVGFTVKYNKELIKIGNPAPAEETILTGSDSKGHIECRLKYIEESNQYFYEYIRDIDRGTSLTYKPVFSENNDFITSNYLDNRLGVYNLLKLAETIENGAIVFTAWEEHNGGSAEFLARFLFEKYNIKQSLISDITWVTEGVKAGEGCAISMRDSGIPRRQYINRIIKLANESTIPFQLEVENAGGSDGTAIQKIPYPIDWCFVGAPESGVHSPNEKVHKKDIDSMLQLYKYLIKHL